jgi:hypothetical protein
MSEGCIITAGHVPKKDVGDFSASPFSRTSLPREYTRIARIRVRPSSSNSPRKISSLFFHEMSSRRSLDLNEKPCASKWIDSRIVVLPQPFGPQITFMPASKLQSIDSRLRTFEMNTLEIKECIPSNQE